MLHGETAGVKADTKSEERRAKSEKYGGISIYLSWQALHEFLFLIASYKAPIVYRTLLFYLLTRRLKVPSMASKSTSLWMSSYPFSMQNVAIITSIVFLIH